MSLNLKALSVTGAVLWGGSFFLVSSANLIWPSYGQLWLDLGASIYPGYRGSSGLASVFIITLYGLFDGAITGAIFAWVYNAVAGNSGKQ